MCKICISLVNNPYLNLGLTFSLKCIRRVCVDLSSPLNMASSTTLSHLRSDKTNSYLLSPPQGCLFEFTDVSIVHWHTHNRYVIYFSFIAAVQPIILTLKGTKTLQIRLLLNDWMRLTKNIRRKKASIFQNLVLNKLVSHLSVHRHKRLWSSSHVSIMT